jgi:glycosyltransferase involved in cell wall biosynthesis
VKVTQVCTGRFHHLDLARQLLRLGALQRFYSGYPARRLEREGIPLHAVASFPWVQTPYLLLTKMAGGAGRLQRESFWLAHESLDRFAARTLPDSDCHIAFSGCGLHAGRVAQMRGASYVCDEAGSHVAYRAQLLGEEYRHYGSKFPGIHERLMQKTLDEYAAADVITVPSEFVARSFVEMGVPRHRLRKVAYGVDTSRFQKLADPPRHTFEVLFVGEVSVRKGVRYLLEAFARLKHPAKRLTVVGAVVPTVRAYLRENPPPEKVTFLGYLPQTELKQIMSRSHVMLMPSIEEGLALVQGQAMACGCPVVASWNSGAADLFTNGKEGFIVTSGNVVAMSDRLQQLADDPQFRNRMSEAALARVASLGGTDSYGRNMLRVLSEVANHAEEAELVA